MTEQICKCCGQSLPAPIDIPSLKGKSKDIFDHVWRAGKVGIDAERLLGLIYQDDPDGGPLWAGTSLRVLICKANRNHLKPAGYMIKGEHSGRGTFGRYRVVKHGAAA